MATSDAETRCSQRAAAATAAEDRGNLVESIANFDAIVDWAIEADGFQNTPGDDASHHDVLAARLRALNVHFRTTDYKGPTQHLLTAVCAHVNLDLGISAATGGAGAMDDLHDDFNMVNAILGSQCQGVQMLIEPGEEPEAVLARQRYVAANSTPKHRDRCHGAMLRGQARRRQLK
ncbi:DUF5995 family protein [Mycolicibacterium sp. P9-64]|uniref:DUF5995 family protein n=1 Tax=Mycolicibacterium sp. P9-64 TaxID=2024612 RepID=UPI00156735D9|nr:DUF5995 family protein [Mycolicibacterium sp. P9-64]